jgi:hypothetical protein
MDRDEIERLRKNVLDYYKQYLATDTIANKINAFCDSANEHLTIAVPFIPTRAEDLAIPGHQL